MLAKKKTVKIVIILEKLISDVLFWDIFSDFSGFLEKGKTTLA